MQLFENYNVKLYMRVIGLLIFSFWSSAVLATGDFNIDLEDPLLSDEASLELVEKFEALETIHYNDTEYYNAAATLNRNVGRLERALEYALQGYQLDNENIENLKTIYTIYFQLKDYEKAGGYLLQAIEILTPKHNPDYITIINKLDKGKNKRVLSDINNHFLTPIEANYLKKRAYTALNEEVKVTTSNTDLTKSLNELNLCLNQYDELSITNSSDTAPSRYYLSLYQ